MNYLKTAVLLTVLSVLLIFSGGALGGNTGMVIALGFAVVMNFTSYWFSDKIVLKMYKAKEVSEADVPEYFGIVKELAMRGKLPMPKVYIMENPTPNAFATGRNPQHAAVAATTGLLELLSKDEVSGVMAHELSHVQNRDILISSIAATIAAAISMLSQMAMFASIFGGRSNDNEGNNPYGMILMIIVGPIAAGIIQMAISRSREFAADRGGAALTGDPLSLASALMKLGQFNKRIPMQANEATAHMFIVSPLVGGKSLRNLFSTHPPIEERVKRLQEMSGAAGMAS